ncbi:MAG: MBL fold metallo-hydrolase [Anaerolineae bacterium]|jgi:metallo-beta-lactamase family protein|nr:MBL fold metallo-hydrolase [Anaerolineae bacterium]
MRITFHGAAQEVTGSMHLIEVNDQRVLLDTGMYQGRRDETYRRNLTFPFDPKTIDAVVLSHAHIDHSGNIPNLVKQGFAGNVWCTAATRNLSVYMLLDSGHIQESDVEYLNKRRKRDGLPPVEPLYTQADAQRALTHFVSVGLGRSIPVADGVKVTFHNAGHILGSAWVALEIKEFATGKEWRLIFSGDLGRKGMAILKDPELPDAADILLLESTYGSRLHPTRDDAMKALRDVVRDTVKHRGKVIIPSFAVGRTQELVYALNELEANGDIPSLPVYVDSPLAVSATEVFRMHPEEWDDEVRAFLQEEKRRNPFDAPNVQYIREAVQSKRLNYLKESAIIISANGMAENGRILHHLKNNIEEPENTILFVSFQAEQTLGRRLASGARRVKILGEEYDVRARVVSIEGYSAHADQAELLAWARPLDRARLKNAYLVHGEPDASSALADKLRLEKVSNVEAPERGRVVEF